MQHTHTITYWCPATGQSKNTFSLQPEIYGNDSFNFQEVFNIKDLFPLLSNSKYHTDYIAVSVDDLPLIHDTDIYSIINTLSTLINCTVVRIGSGKPVKRTTKLVAIVGEKTSKQLIKEILSMKEIHCLICKEGEVWTHDTLMNSLVSMTTNTRVVPDCVKGLIRPKKIVVDESINVSLTTRQEQVFNIITNRGCSNKQIAKILCISESTVKLHMSAIFKKYGVKNRTQLAVFAKQ